MQASKTCCVNGCMNWIKSRNNWSFLDTSNSSTCILALKKMCRPRQVVPGTCTLLLRVPTTQFNMKLCCTVIYIVCMTSEVMMNSPTSRGMTGILPNLINLHDILNIEGICLVTIDLLYSRPPCMLHQKMSKAVQFNC